MNYIVQYCAYVRAVYAEGRVTESPHSGYDLPSAQRSTRDDAPKKTSLNLVLAGVIAVIVILAALTLTWLFS